jgi:hypothetical protein
MTVRLPSLLLAVLALGAGATARADSAPFDLAGPNLQITVTRGAVTRPIGEVPNLVAGDRLWIKADLPATQSAHYLMVVAFLRGSTNPPPADWFYRCETWGRDCAKTGLTVTVPQDAQQVLVFLAPATGGDFRTLMNAVRGRPGAFVRTSQDLNQATLDRSRLDVYLSAIRAIDETDHARLQEATPLLARSLSIKVDAKCLDRIPELQAPCLMQGQESLVLNDGHSTSIVEALTSGPASDLAMEASYTPQLSYGYYSPYIASVMDIARILDSFRSAQYQYIPALASPQGEGLALTLNTPPSFHDPKSVLVAALPAVEPPQTPPLHAVNPAEIYCARKTPLVLPVEGAPLVFSTHYAHDLTLSLSGKDGKTVELPVTANAQQGGLVVDASGRDMDALGDGIRGSLHGYWGFEQYAGPGFQLVNARAQTWMLASAEEAVPVVGREDIVHLQAADVSCIQNVTLKDADGKELKTEWKIVKSTQVEVRLALQEAKPGTLMLLVAQYGFKQPQSVPLRAFSQAGHLDGFTIHAGDAQGVLKGSRLDQVGSLIVKGVELTPGQLSSSQGSDELTMLAKDAQPPLALKPGESFSARATLKDGRVIDLAALADAPRPSVTLIAKSVQPSHSSSGSNIQLADQDDLPNDAKLTFSLRAQSPPLFAHDERIEIATADESFSANLGLGNGVTLESAKVAVASLDPTNAFGTSAFGRLQFRAIVNGVKGDWQPLVTLVRLPMLKELKCPSTPELACKLSGANLFLIDSISSDARFDHPVQIPDGFPGSSLPVPHPANGQLYVKLRDDPSVINQLVLLAQPLPPTTDEAARTVIRQAATHAEDHPADGAPKIPPEEVPPLPQSAPGQPQQLPSVN